MTNKIPPPPPGCYPSCRKDQVIADRIGKSLFRAAIVFGVIVGSMSAMVTVWAIADILKR